MNDLTKIPAAACWICGGWTKFGGMSHYADSTTFVLGRTGCTCAQAPKTSQELIAQASTESLAAHIANLIHGNTQLSAKIRRKFAIQYARKLLAEAQAMPKT